MLRRPAVLALAAVAAALGWQSLTVRYNYGGNWTGLFCIATGWKPPAFLAHEAVYVFPDSLGYDGMQFHIVAHDPWMRRGGAQAVDVAALRYPRILVPALAWAVALGRDEWIHAAYLAVTLAFLFAGVYWLALLAQRFGLHPAWGLTLAATPAALVSLDRLTVDLALAALCAGFVWFTERGSRGVYAALALAPLVRETGFVFIGGYGLWALARRRFGDLAATAASALPGAGWSLWVMLNTGANPGADLANDMPMFGLVERLLHRQGYALPAWQARLAEGLDLAAVAGIAVMLGAAAWIARRRQGSASAVVLYVSAASAILVSSRWVWEDVFGFGRVMTPALMLAGVEAVRAGRPWLALAPVLMVDARIALNFARQVAGVVGGVAGV
jgi:hypothetical protein